jgi:hypothetical protein
MQIKAIAPYKISALYYHRLFSLGRKLLSYKRRRSLEVPSTKTAL